MLTKLQKDLKAISNKSKAAVLQRYFKTGKGEYGEGDIFLGITVPLQRKLARKYIYLTFADLDELIASKIHEYRFTALEILVAQFERGTEADKKEIYKFYIEHRAYINNWDLVDTSAPYIVGAYLEGKGKDILYKLARSKNIWDRRIAIIATQWYIRSGHFTETLRIAEMLLHDEHDLIHKAVGWMLREVGNRNKKSEVAFLNTYAPEMPRTMLRYAIEKFPKEIRQEYLKKKAK